MPLLITGIGKLSARKQLYGDLISTSNTLLVMQFVWVRGGGVVSCTNTVVMNFSLDLINIHIHLLFWVHYD